MLISLNWIKEFVDLPDMPPKDLASKFTLSTAEVEDVIVKGEELTPILCVEITSIKKHPDSDKLNLVTFDIGAGKTKEVVCGAPNVRIGLKVPFAPIGTTLPNGMTLTPKKIRGVLSEGMLCSEVELGLGEGKAGLMELSDSVAPGTPLTDYLNLEKDIILDVDNKSLTHRPDLWGYLGLAREFAAAHKKTLINKYTSDWEKVIEEKFSQDKAPVEVEVDKDSSCLAYYGLSLDIPKMGKTPNHIKNRLEANGLRSINLIVDISNYVMLELGIPNHIFDRSKILGDKVFIKRAKTPFEFKTLDEVNRNIISSDTMIFDSEKPLVLAGLMGGAESGVDEESTKLFLEVANWEASEVRKSSVRLGLRTDSSQRYEKTLDSNQCYRTLLRMTELIVDLCPGSRVIGKPQVFLNQEKLSHPLDFNISYDQIIKTLGTNVSLDTIVDIFSRLDFKVAESEGVFSVTVPSYRTTKDISVKADLIEEIGRMIGYDNIIPISPLVPVRPIRLSPTKVFHRKLQDFLVMHGKCLQVMTYPLVGKGLLSKAMWEEANDKLSLVNALSVDQDRMRPSLIPSAVELSALNYKNYDEFAFFEIGRSYLDFTREESHLIIGMYSKDKTRFLELENVVEKLLSFLNVNFNFCPMNEKFSNCVLPSSWKGIHPHEYLNIQIRGKYKGVINSVHPLVLKNFKMKGNLSLAVVDLTEIESQVIKDKTKYHFIPKFPSSQSDFTVVMDKNIPAASALDCLSSLRTKELKSKKILDVFDMNDTQKAVSIRVLLEDPEKTLSAETIKEIEMKIVQTLDKSGFPLRS